MTSDLEDQLISGMHDEVSGVAFSRDVLAEAGLRHRRRVARHRTAYAAGVVAVVGALVAVATVGTGVPGGTQDSPGPVAGRPPAAGADSPQLRLAAAAAASQGISYRVKVTTTSKDAAPPAGELPEPVGRSWVTTGAFDPTTVTGYLESPYGGKLRPVIAAGYEHERLLGGVHYTGARDGADPENGRILWRKQPGKQESLDYDMAMGGGLGASADPQELFRLLRQAGATVTERAAGVYHFEVTVADAAAGILADHLAGEVTIGADGRIAKVAYARTAKTRIHGSDHTYHLGVVLELSGYGAPVRVEAPSGADLLPSK
ncbi:hypothetical protein [Micromonospora musae]|uniref:CU044_5270 family protein n=1 Tax=Micromonospora musae TaxID=1894970 RepID=A0A3A9XS31_9ACTN|nr:hypothetical protein [Micromonospora musae]RKN27928.1 hypothetical protein D7044_27350 [Micromonospora musae]